MSIPSKVFAVLGLFTRERPVWQPEEIYEALGYSRPTGYRYVKDLVEAGLLRKVSAGRYGLGARIIELDYQLRQSDPLLLAAMPVMAKLAPISGFDAVLSVLYAGPRVIDVHRVTGESNLALSYGRGRPRPLFQSGAPKVLLSGLARGPLLKIYEDRSEEIAASGMGRTWTEFRTGLKELRRRGFYRSSGELEPALGAMAVPVENGDGDCVAALALVGSVPRIDREEEARLYRWLRDATDEIRRNLAAQGNVERQATSSPSARSSSESA